PGPADAREAGEDGAQPFQGGAAVPELAPPLGGRDRHSGRQVNETDGARGLVPVLAARSPADERRDLALAQQRLVVQPERGRCRQAPVLWDGILHAAGTIASAAPFSRTDRPISETTAFVGRPPSRKRSGFTRKEFTLVRCRQLEVDPDRPRPWWVRRWVRVGRRPQEPAQGRLRGLGRPEPHAVPCR